MYTHLFYKRNAKFSSFNERCCVRPLQGDERQEQDNLTRFLEIAIFGKFSSSSIGPFVASYMP